MVSGFYSAGHRSNQHYPARATTYTIDALDQRVAKAGPLGNSRFVYMGQNKLMAEHSNGQSTS